MARPPRHWIELNEEERAVLERMARADKLPFQEVQRARIVLYAAQGVPDTDIARLQARTGDTVTTLLHTSIRIDDAAGRRLLTLLDGTRDRGAVLAAMAHEAAPSRDLATRLDAKLGDLARLALLER